MSYSFSVKGANKAAAKAEVEKKFDEAVLAVQPAHALDRKAVLAHAGVVIDMLDDDDTKDVTVSVNGYISGYDFDKVEPRLNSAAISCSAGLVVRI